MKIVKFYEKHIFNLLETSEIFNNGNAHTESAWLLIDAERWSTSK